MSVRFDFSAQTVIVTGGSSGIGRAIAAGFRDAGAAVVITGTRDGPDDYPEDIATMTYRQVEMQDHDALDAFTAEFASVDVLVNSAGTTVRGEAAFTPENFEKILDINLAGSYRMAHGLLPALKQARGSVINIASMFSYFASPRAPGYGASKSAIVQLTKSLGAAWAQESVRVNGIAPGWIDTKLTKPVQETEWLNRPILERTPMGRWGRPDEMVGAALFLASDQASFVTGVTIPVDGGYSAL